MARRTRLSVASAATPAPLPDLTQLPYDQSDDTMDIDFSGQLLTPENSRSETSSNNDNASMEDNGPALRRSTRARRPSLRHIDQLNSSKMEGIESSLIHTTKTDTGSAGFLAHIDLSGGQATRSSRLRHSIAVMQSSSWSETTLAKEHLEVADFARAPATPISESSQEPQLEDSTVPLSQRTLRKRPERVVATKPDKNESDRQPILNNAEKDSSPRRSSRLSLLGRASDLVDKASSVLGKRSRDVMEKGKELGRRASLRPRNLLQLKDQVNSQPEDQTVPDAKKRRVSQSDLPSKSTPTEPSTPEEQPAPKPVQRFRTKSWLNHGLYVGQAYTTEARPSQNRRRSSKAKDATPPQRKYLPLPMFAGDRLLKNGRNFQLPFDIFSPLPPGQPKPNEWKKVNKNVFVGEAVGIWRANKNMELSTCMCTEETGCDENCQNRYMFYECDNGNCRLGPHCGNRNFEELKQRTKAGGKYNIGVEVIKTEDRGYGVRSNRTFEPNQIIVEYTGEIITQTECESRMRTLYKKNECYYLMYFDQNMIIDATRGSIARFVNHSCEPNCRMEKWTVAGKPRMALFAGDKGVMTGEELSYDYNFDPYSQRNVQECRCGSSKCRGVLGPRPKEKEARREAKEAREALAKRKSGSSKKRSTAKLAGSKRKREDAARGNASRTKKRKILTSRSLKKGAKKVIAKTRTAVTKRTSTASKPTKSKAKVTLSGKKKSNSKATITKKTASPKKSGTSKSPVKTKTQSKSRVAIKLPKIKSKIRVKATVSSKTTKSKGDKVPRKSPTKSKGSNTLNRPSASTKAKILAAAKKGTGVRLQPKQVKKVEKRTSPQKTTSRKVSPRPKEKKSVTSQGVKRAVSSGKVVKNVAKKAMKTVKSPDKTATTAKDEDKTLASKAHALAGFFSRSLSVF